MSTVRNLIIPGKEWGWFDRDMKPLATGDMWHHLECPNPVYSTHMAEDYSGEFSEEIRVERCPTKFISAKREDCSRCGRIFIYP